MYRFRKVMTKLAASQHKSLRLTAIAVATPVCFVAGLAEGLRELASELPAFGRELRSIYRGTFYER